ncbi:MAG TPA: hypothetical protein VFB42_01915 [Gaiellaceae bacterium]|nr:hypothetical protein [Gaiellaceae bacterium]
MSRAFEDWVDVEGLSPEERGRLERVHELLLAAGPPAELPAGLERPPAQVIAFPGWRRRPWAAVLAAAALLVAASFTAGYVAGDREGGGTAVVRTAALEDSRGGRALASLRVGERYASGNWPIELTVRGLPPLTDVRAYYLLLVWRDGKPAGVCGAFRVQGSETNLHFDVPYAIDDSTRWVVTRVDPGERYPGDVVMKTV